MKHINNKGVTLNEVLISLAVLAFGILSLMLLYTSGIRGVTKAQSLTRKNNQATAKIEKIMSMKYSELKDGCEPETIQNITMTTCLKVTENTPITNTKKVEVDISFENNKAGAISYEYIKPYHK